MVLSNNPSESRWQVEAHPILLKPAPFQPINNQDGVTGTYAKV